MLDKIKPQSTHESETDDDERAVEQEPAHSSERVADGSARAVHTSESAPETAPEEPRIELDEVFGLLKNRRRRDVLRLLTETNEAMRLGEVAEIIAAQECEKDVSQINSQERKRVYVGLYQCHLPKLADVGAINYNKPRGTIERGPTFDQITHYLPEEPQSEQDTREQSLMESLTNMMAAGKNLL